MNKNPAQFLYNFPLDIFGRAPTVLAREILSIGILHKFFIAILCILTIEKNVDEWPSAFHSTNFQNELCYPFTPRNFEINFRYLTI